MPTYHTDILIPAALVFTFDFVSDFRHAGQWDPRVRQASRIDGDGPLGVGTRFVLDSPGPFGTITFPYEIVVYDRPHRVTLRGETSWARYRDELRFSAASDDTTTLTYDAVFDLRGWATLGTPFMARYFQRIGDDATRGIPDAVARAADTRRQSGAPVP